MTSSDTIGKLTEALAKAQLVFLPIKQSEAVDFMTKAGQRKKYSYAPLSEVIDACRKGLSENGLAILQPTKMVENKLVVETLLAHNSGEWIKSEIQIDSQDPSPQGIGSALTYARRYALSALLGVASEEDDDGEGGGDKVEKKAKVEKPPEHEESQEKAHWCTEHNVAYRKFEKEGRTWYSHKQGDVWCNEDKGKAKIEVAKPVIAPQSPASKKQVEADKDNLFGEDSGNAQNVVVKSSPPITEAMLKTINANAKKMGYEPPELSALVKHAYQIDDLHLLTIARANNLLDMIARGEKAPEV